MNISLSWREKTIYPVVVAVMIGCCLFSIVQAVERFAGSRLDLYVVTLVGMLAALQSFYTQRLAMGLRLDGWRRTLLYPLELALLLALARVGLFASDVLIGRSPHFNIFDFDLRWGWVIAMMVLAWLFARTAAEQFARLHRLPVEHRETEVISRQWVSPYDVLRSLFFRGGMVLMFFSGLAYVSFGEYQDRLTPPAQFVTLNILLYFGIGLILLGQAYFDSMRRRWFVDEVKVAPQTGAGWLIYSLILIGLAALVAFLAPVSYSLGLLDALRTALSVILSLLYLPVILFVGLLGYLLRLLLGQPEPLAPPPESPVDDLIPPADATSSLMEWLARLDWPSIQSMLSWLMVLVIIIYVIRSYLLDNIEFSLRLGQIGIIRFLIKMWQALRGSMGGMAEDVGELAGSLLQFLVGRQRMARRPLGRLFWGRPSPRERIRYLYLSALKRAAERGLGRRTTQTPYEYENVLGPRVPDAEEDVAQLTEAFVEARYSRQPVRDDDIGPIYEAWLRLRAALRRTRPHQ